MLVYLDLVVLLNFLVDFLLLLGTNRLAGFPSEGKRLVSAAALGGLYSAGCMLPGFRFLGNILWRLVSLAGIAGIAFGWNRSTLKRCGVFVLLSMALGGIAIGFGRANIPSLVLASLVVWLLCAIAFGGSIQFVAITLLTTAFDPIQAFFLSVMVNARHIFYGLALLDKYKGLGKLRAFLIYTLCDETFSLVSVLDVQIGRAHV